MSGYFSLLSQSKMEKIPHCQRPKHNYFPTRKYLFPKAVPNKELQQLLFLFNVYVYRGRLRKFYKINTELQDGTKNTKKIK